MILTVELCLTWNPCKRWTEKDRLEKYLQSGLSVLHILADKNIDEKDRQWVAANYMQHRKILCTTREVLQACISTNPMAALFFMAEELEQNTLEALAVDFPGLALSCAADIMSASALDVVAKKLPIVALRYAGHILPVLSSDTLSYCEEHEARVRSGLNLKYGEI